MDDDRKVPLAGDPSWEQRTAPLLQFLEEPRSHKELDVWRSTNKVPSYTLPHMLAWLESKHLVYWNEERKTWHKRFAQPLHKEVVVTKKKPIEEYMGLVEPVQVKIKPTAAALKKERGNDYKEQERISKSMERRLAMQKAAREQQKKDNAGVPEAKWPALHPNQVEETRARKEEGLKTWLEDAIEIKPTAALGDLKWFARGDNIACMGPYDDREEADAATISAVTGYPVEAAHVWCARVKKGTKIPLTRIGKGKPEEVDAHKALYEVLVDRMPHMKMPRKLR